MARGLIGIEVDTGGGIKDIGPLLVEVRKLFQSQSLYDLN